MENELVWTNEGFVLNDAGHLIITSFIDLRKPEDRTPIGTLVRGCERKYALEECETLMISNPARFRSFGEELILDVQEGLAKEESVITLEETAVQATRRRAVSDLDQALSLLDTQMRLSYRETHTNTETHNESLTYGKEWWILCTSVKPDDEEWDSWRGTLPDGYDHVSEISQPAKFAQALAHMVAEQAGPRGQEGTMRDTMEGSETEETTHKTQWVVHGPVVYTDSVLHALDGITDNTHRIAASIFTKGSGHAQQREYRFAVLNEGADEESVILRISGMMRDALKPTEHGLVRAAPVPLNTAAGEDTGTREDTRGINTPIAKHATISQRSAEREEWKLETRGPDGEVLSSEGSVRKSVKERSFTQSQEPEVIEFIEPNQRSQGREDAEDTLSPPGSSEYSEYGAEENNDQDAVKELALEEFDFDDQHTDDMELAIPIVTVTGRVYKSFEDMLSDPTYPMSPMGKVWEEDANTPDEIIKTYRTIDVLNLKMKDVSEQFRQDIASAGWYAMLCIRNIYGRLGDIVHTVSIEKERFVLIRLKEADSMNATGRIVIAPSGAYAYSFHLEKAEQLGYGGLEWGTMFFPIGSQLETFETYGWPKKVV